MTHPSVTEGGIDHRLFGLVERLRTSFWALPAALCASVLALSSLTLWIDDRVDWNATALDAVLYSGTPTDARTVLTAMASSLITVAGVVFSITIVALSFASTHLGPRLMREFMRDRGTQFVLGCFIASFLGCLVVLTALHGNLKNPVSRLATTQSLVLTTLSFGVLIAYFHHLSSRIRVDYVIAAVFGDLTESIDKLFPEDLDPIPGHAGGSEFPLTSAPGTVIAQRSGYIQAIDYAHLGRLAEEHQLSVGCLERPSAFIAEGNPLAHLTRAPSPELASTIEKCFVIGPARTEVQDIEYSIRELVEIALRALSPGVNDPFTAIACVDHLGAAMARLVNRNTPEWNVHEAKAGFAVYFRCVTFEGAMDTAWRQIRQCGAGQPAVAIRVLESLSRVAYNSRDEARLAVVRRQADELLDQARRGHPIACDLRGIEERHAALMRQFDELAASTRVA